MSKESRALTAIVLGLVLLIASFAWSNSSSAPSDFTNEEAAEYIAAGAKLHEMSFNVRDANKKPTAGDGKVSAEEREAQKKVYEERKAAIENSRSRQSILSWSMFGAGIVLTIGGLFAQKLSNG